MLLDMSLQNEKPLPRKDPMLQNVRSAMLIKTQFDCRKEATKAPVFTNQDPQSNSITMKISLFGFVVLISPLASVVLVETDAISSFNIKRNYHPHGRFLGHISRRDEQPNDRYLISTACANAFTDLNTANPQFELYNAEVFEAAETLTCEDKYDCGVDGKEVKGSNRYLQLVQQCQDLGETPFYEYIEADCGPDGYFYVDN